MKIVKREVLSNTQSFSSRFCNGYCEECLLPIFKRQRITEPTSKDAEPTSKGTQMRESFDLSTYPTQEEFERWTFYVGMWLAQQIFGPAGDDDENFHRFTSFLRSSDSFFTPWKWVSEEYNNEGGESAMAFHKGSYFSEGYWCRVHD